MSPPLWNPFSRSSSSEPLPKGPFSIVESPRVDQGVVADVTNALAITIRCHGWPILHGRHQPQIQIRVGSAVVTQIPAMPGEDPFKRSIDDVRILIGEDFIRKSFVAQRLIKAGFGHEKIWVQVLAHEAYHSNGGEYLEKSRVPFPLFQEIFTGAIRPDFSENLCNIFLKIAEQSKAYKVIIKRSKEQKISNEKAVRPDSFDPSVQ